MTVAPSGGAVSGRRCEDPEAEQVVCTKAGEEASVA